MSTLKPLPNLADVEAMASRGRFSAVMACRGEVVQMLRDVAVSAQSADLHDLRQMADTLREVADRFEALSALEF